MTTRSDENPLHNHLTALFIAFVVTMAVYSERFGYLVLVLIAVSFVIGWFFLEHFTLHKDTWWRRSLYMEKFLNSVVMENRDVVEQPIKLELLTGKLVEKALDFIKKDRGEKPFGLYMSFPAPHAPLRPNKDSKAVH